MATSEKDSSDGEDNPALGLNWQVSRWGREDQRGNGNLMNAAKVLEASRLIKTGEIVSLGRRLRSRHVAGARPRICSANARRTHRRTSRRPEPHDLER